MGFQMYGSYIGIVCCSLGCCDCSGSFSVLPDSVVGAVVAFPTGAAYIAFTKEWRRDITGWGGVGISPPLRVGDKNAGSTVPTGGRIGTVGTAT